MRAPRTGLLVTAASLAVCAGALGACQSTQDRSAALAKNASELISDKGLKIDEKSTSVEVVSTAVVAEPDRAAGVVELRNTSGRTLVNVPLLIDLKGANGKSVYANDVPGLDFTLISVPVIEPGQTVTWVDDQITATAPPETLQATAGETSLPPPSEVPEVKVGEPSLHVDPVSGTEATGSIENLSGTMLPLVYFYAVARQGDKVVAAGRGAFERLQPDKPKQYHIFFVGDPGDADVTVTAMPIVNDPTKTPAISASEEN